MNVTRIHTKTGSHIEPPLNPGWIPLRKLNWQASVTALDTGFSVQVNPAKYWIGGIRKHGHYDIITPHETSGPHTFEQAWYYLIGIGTGAHNTKVNQQP